MENTAEVKALLESAVIDLYDAEKFCEVYLLKAQKLFLEGEKRRLRYLSVKYHELIRYFQTDFYDLYMMSLDCKHIDKTYAQIGGITDFFKKTCGYLNDLYVKLHKAANDLMPVLGYKYSCKLLEMTNELSCIIIEYNRIIGEGDSCGWSNDYIQRVLSKNQTAENIHDHYEQKEAKLGYTY